MRVRLNGHRALPPTTRDRRSSVYGAQALCNTAGLPKAPGQERQGAKYTDFLERLLQAASYTPSVRNGAQRSWKGCCKQQCCKRLIENPELASSIYPERQRLFGELSEEQLALYIIANVVLKNDKPSRRVLFCGRSLCRQAFAAVAACGRDRVGSVLKTYNKHGRQAAVARAIRAPSGPKKAPKRDAIRAAVDAWVHGVGYVSTRGSKVYLPGLSVADAYEAVLDDMTSALRKLGLNVPSMGYFEQTVCDREQMGGVEIVWGDRHEHKRCTYVYSVERSEMLTHAGVKSATTLRSRSDRPRRTRSFGVTSVSSSART
jgi:hypothetical protein